MKALLIKDLRILRRSPLLVGVLVVYPLVIALLLGLALSRGPDKPRVAIYNQLAGTAPLSVGGETVDPTDYARELFKSVEPVDVHSRAEAIAKVRSGETLAAIIVPKDLLERLQDLVALGGGARPTVEVFYSGRDPVKRQFVESTIDSRVADLNRAVADKVTTVAAGYINLLLRGGHFGLFGRSFDVVGLERSKQKIDAVATRLPAGSADRRALEQVSEFAGIAIRNLDLSTDVLSTVGSPVKVVRKDVAGSGTPLDRYAISVAVMMSLLLIAVLLASGLFALEREENTLPRLMRGVTTAGRLVAGKTLLAALCGAGATLLLAAVVSLLVDLDWSRIVLWAVALTVSGLACAAFGAAIGAIAREVRAASLLAILLTLPLALLALVPDGSLASWLYDAIRALAALFPPRSSLRAIDWALNGSPGGALALAHLAGLAAAWFLLARTALRRMA